MKKLLAFLLSLFLIFGLAGCTTTTEDDSTSQEEETSEVVEEDDSEEAVVEDDDEAVIDEDGIYTTKDDVALYLHTYDKLPSNFITKKEAKALGWSGGGLDAYAKDKCIGGDYFGNYEEILPTDDTYHECDIDTLNQNSRGAKRIIYSEDGDIYYTEDHYETFTLLYEGE